MPSLYVSEALVSVGRSSILALIVTLLAAQGGLAQAPYDSTAFAALHWREIGIFRG